MSIQQGPYKIPLKRGFKIIFDGHFCGGRKYLGYILKEICELKFLDYGLMYKALGYINTFDCWTNGPDSAERATEEFIEGIDHSKLKTLYPEDKAECIATGDYGYLRDQLVLNRDKYFNQDAPLILSGRHLAAAYPEADLKIFITADFNTRFLRYKAKIDEGGYQPRFQREIRNDDKRVKENDYTHYWDIPGEYLPGHPNYQENTMIFDTTGMSVGEQIEKLLEIIEGFGGMAR
ncbi:cytidylate kinase-like [Scomber scombrus]|uniref:cytidylate kinase-like n=1 Tax=Scomber scombrus TaxID=13677 RepID=UPI002DD9CA43|nr:cytidylate kinase-like [Scomber scombrus]